MTDASQASAAYDRALRDYTQLLRHRIANPLTAISAGLSTLRDIPVDDATRASIMEDMIKQAAALRLVALQPLTISAEEHDLQPIVDTLRAGRGASATGNDLRLADRQRRAGLNESRFRTINTQIVKVSADEHPLIEIACECSSLDCADGVQVTASEYESIHAHGARFIVAAGHEQLDVENVIDQSNDWWIVEKIGAAREEALRQHDLNDQ